MGYRIWGAVLMLVFGCPVANAQVEEDTLTHTYILGAVVIHGRAEGLNLEGFMEQVKKDTTFLHAFLNLRYWPHAIEGDLNVQNKGERDVATLYRSGALERQGERATLKVDSTAEGGRLRKRNGTMRYITAELFDDLFFPEGTWVADNTVATYEQRSGATGRIGRYKAELKKFMFNPGQEIAGLPLIGNKMALFEPDMVPYYELGIDQEFRSGQACWRFTALAKDSVEGRPARDNATVIKHMTTWFDQATMQVIAREYRIAHNSMVMDFDISIHVDNALVNGELVPMRIRYDGDWNIPLRKRELVQFWLKMSGWEIG